MLFMHIGSEAAFYERQNTRGNPIAANREPRHIARRKIGLDEYMGARPRASGDSSERE